MRVNVILLLVIQSVLAAGLIYGILTAPAQGPGGSDFMQSFIKLIVVAYVVFALPAWGLVWLNRWLPLALVLALVIPAGFVLLFGLPL
jgi:hypothetical protein